MLPAKKKKYPEKQDVSKTTEITEARRRARWLSCRLFPALAEFNSKHVAKGKSPEFVCSEAQVMCETSSQMPAASGQNGESTCT